MALPAVTLEDDVNWNGGEPAAWVPHPVGCDCVDCIKGLKGGPVLAQPSLLRLIGSQTAPTKAALTAKERAAAAASQTTIAAENKRIRKERLKRLVLAMHGKRTRNRSQKP